MKRILIVEDDRGLREGIELALKREDFCFTSCGSMEEARRAAEREAFELVLLDLNLPDGSGYDFLKYMKEKAKTPVIILTANDLEMDEVKGLELGAEDYITKPFSLMVLRARIDKVFQRSEALKGAVCQFGKYSFDFGRMRFEKRKPSGEREEIILSKTEQKLLQVLVENKNIVLSRETLVDRIWTDGYEYVDENALSVAVRRLREKLEEGQDGYLQTVYGKGYIWKA